MRNFIFFLRRKSVSFRPFSVEIRRESFPGYPDIFIFPEKDQTIDAQRAAFSDNCHPPIKDCTITAHFPEDSVSLALWQAS